MKFIALYGAGRSGCSAARWSVPMLMGRPPRGTYIRLAEEGGLGAAER